MPAPHDFPVPNKRAGDVEPSRRMTNTEVTVPAPHNISDLAEKLEDVDNGNRLALFMGREVMHEADRALAFDGLGGDPVPDLDQEVDDLSAALRIVEAKLVYLRGAVGEKSLAAPMIDLMGMSADEVRHQVPAVRHALRDEAGR